MFVDWSPTQKRYHKSPRAVVHRADLCNTFIDPSLLDHTVETALMNNTAQVDLATVIRNTISCAFLAQAHRISVSINKAALDDVRSRNLDIECTTHISLNRLFAASPG